MKNKGIVLKDYSPIKRVITILDLNLGKIQAIYKKQRFMPKISVGTIISYSAISSNAFFKLDNIDIIYMPMDFGKINLLFLHHLLELSYYFLQESSDEEYVFQLIIYVYKNINTLKSVFDKKKIICKFFKILGIYPEDMTIFPKGFEDLISHVINSKVTEKNDLLILNEYINNWILECIYTHPENNKFKTLNFLKSQDNYE